MKKRAFLWPRGTLERSRGEKALSVGRKRVKYVLRGILILVILTSNCLRAQANSIRYQPDYQDGIPNEIREYCELVGAEYDICPELLEAMAYNESRFLPEVQNGDHYGLMQINVKIHANRIEKYGWTEQDMFDAYKNLVVAGDLLHELYETYGDDNPVVLAYYAGYSSTIKTYLRTGVMCPYANYILTKSAEYERLHGK